MIAAAERIWELGKPLGLAPSLPLQSGQEGEERGATASWSALRPAARPYVLLVILAGGFALVASVPFVAAGNVRLFAVLTALSIAASLAKISIPVPRSDSTLTVCYVLDFTTLLVLGPAAATLTAGLGAWTQCTLRRREPAPLFQAWFSVGTLALTVQAAGFTYRMLGGEPGFATATFHLEALIATATVFFFLNSALVAMAIALSTGQSPLRVWTASYLWSWPGHLLGFALVVGASYGIGRSRLWLIPFSAVSLGLVYQNFTAYVKRFSDSVTDPLTGLPNVRALMSHAAQELARAQRDDMPMAVLLIDLDGFKTINDTFGHGAGDVALRQVGQCVQHGIRVYDTCARYGGDEFVAVLPGCDIVDARRKAAALEAAVAALTFQPKGDAVPLKISVGVAVFPEDGDTFEALLEAADARMFADKETHAAREPRRRKGAIDQELQQHIMEAQRLEAVGQLAGGVAHDFNNALTAIMGYTDLLTEQIGPDKPIGRDLQEIVGAAQHAASLTHQLLAFSRKQSVSTVEVDLNDVVERAEAMLRRVLGERIVVATQLAGDLHAIAANTSQLEQIVVNLCVNARDAMPEGGTLTIQTRNVETAAEPGAEPAAFVELSVTDTGIGMPEEVKARIFEVFFTTKGPGKGTGLGLAAVHGIVSQMNGSIQVDSEPGHGSTFRILLPCADHVPAGRATAAPPVPVPAVMGLETILLVEDEAAVRQFAAIALERHGYRVLEAHSGEAALKLLEGLSCPIDLLLTDIVLPGIDGCELAARVERLRPEAATLFTTGYSDALRQNALTAEEPLVVLHKPFTARALLEKAREAIDQRAA
jgi:diguanylate cyclase (GGDEF)-like protein